MRVAAYQMPANACYAPDGVAHLSARVRECETAGARLLCCPEGALGGLADYVDAPDDIAISADPQTLARTLRPLASPHVALVIGFTERDAAGRYYNAAVVYHDGAVLGVYRKHHPAIRRSRYSPGTEMPVFRVNDTVIGVLICRDSTDMRLAKTLVHRGAEVLCVPTNNAMPPDRGGPGLVDEVYALDVRLATSLGVTVIRADAIGESRGLVSAGASVVTHPSGTQLRAHGRNGGELIVTELPDIALGMRRSVGVGDGAEANGA